MSSMAPELALLTTGDSTQLEGGEKNGRDVEQ